MRGLTDVERDRLAICALPWPVWDPHGFDPCSCDEERRDLEERGAVLRIETEDEIEYVCTEMGRIALRLWPANRVVPR